MSELKKLGFVASAAGQASAVAASAYSTARGFVPAFAEPYVVQLEETATTLATPYFERAQDAAEKVLQGADGQVDASLELVASAVSYSRDLHSKNMQTFNGAKEQYFGLVEAAVASAKALLDPTPFVAAVGSTVGRYADPDKIVDTSFEVAGKVAAFGPVNKAVEAADPLIKSYVKAYSSVHDSVVSLPVYKKLWELAASTSSSVQDSWVVKKAVELGYPLLAPVADPVVANITNSKYLKQLQSHLEPAKSA